MDAIFGKSARSLGNLRFRVKCFAAEGCLTRNICDANRSDPANVRAVIALATASQKGGVGKTTVCINLGHALARRGWNVLLVDTDPQGGIGLSLSRTTRHKRGFYDFLAHGGEVRPLILPTRLPEFSVLPCGTQNDFPRTGHSDQAPQKLRELLRQCDLLAYDCVIL